MIVPPIVIVASVIVIVLAGLWSRYKYVESAMALHRMAHHLAEQESRAETLALARDAAVLVGDAAAAALAAYEARDAAATTALAAYLERDGAVAALAVAEQQQPETLTPEELKVVAENLCSHCGGAHKIACPRVRSLRFRADGQTALAVEFFADQDWPKDHVVFLDDYVSSPSLIVQQ